MVPPKRFVTVYPYRFLWIIIRVEVIQIDLSSKIGALLTFNESRLKDYQQPPLWRPTNSKNTSAFDGHHLKNGFCLGYNAKSFPFPRSSQNTKFISKSSLESSINPLNVWGEADCNSSSLTTKYFRIARLPYFESKFVLFFSLLDIQNVSDTFRTH